jgi:hypothetical protein
MKDGKPYALSMPVLCDVQPVQSLTTTGEWTADDDGVLLPMHRFVGQYAKEIADTHNAALAAERELGQQECNRLDAFWQNEVAKQLAAERKIWDNRIAKAIKIITAERKECSLLSIQLMDCYGKLAEVQQALAEERGS